jgi:hypothetical protein
MPRSLIGSTTHTQASEPQREQLNRFVSGLVHARASTERHAGALQCWRLWRVVWRRPEGNCLTIHIDDRSWQNARP